MVKLDLTGTQKFAPAPDTAACKAAIDTLVNGTGAGNDFTGWVDLPEHYDRAEFARIQAAAKKIRQAPRRSSSSASAGRISARAPSSSC